jgi:anti-sigma B factor antagonist
VSITTHIHGSVASISLSGAVDYSTQDEFRAANTSALSATNVREIQVDLGEVTFLDSSAIRALLILQKQAEEQGISLVLLNCGRSIRDIFEVGGFDTMFMIR